MEKCQRCAVAATAFPEEAERIRLLLETAGFSRVISVSDGRAAEAAVNRCLPDALIAEQVLPGMDGLTLASRICAAPLTVHPAVVLLTLPGMRKRVPEHVGIAIEKPVSEKMLLSALDRLQVERREIPSGKSRRAEEILRALGVPEHCGKDYLLRAIEMVWVDARLLKSLTVRLYPAVAERFCVGARHAERAMRHVIDAAWRSGEIEAQYKIFGDTIDASRGCPTCGEMIAQIADILRWEGKA